MNKVLKWIIIIILSIATLIGISYGAYKLYNYVVKDITQKVKKGVAQGVQEGIGSAMDPAKLIDKIFKR